MAAKLSSYYTTKQPVKNYADNRITYRKTVCGVILHHSDSRWRALVAASLVTG